MNRELKCGLLALLYFVLLPSFPMGLNVIWIKVRMYKLAHADHQRVLLACRQILENPDVWKPEFNPWGHTEYIDVEPPFSRVIPEIIQNMNPGFITIDSSKVLLNFSVVGARIGVLGFREGAKQFGTFKYIDGLWFWNGKDNTKTNDQPPAIVQAMAAYAAGPPKLKLSQKAGLVLTFLGCFGCVLSYLVFIVAAFRSSFVWGFFMPLLGLVLIPFFLCYRFEPAKRPFFYLLVSFALIVSGMGILTFIA